MAASNRRYVDTGIPHLDKQLTADLTLMEISEIKQQFEEFWDRLFGKQPRLPLFVAKELGTGDANPSQ
jgi:hypothetical protein